MFSATLVMIESAPVSFLSVVRFYRKKYIDIDFSLVSCRVVKDALEWSYRPTCTSPTSQPGKMEMGTHFHGVLEVGSRMWAEVFLGIILT